MAIVIISSLAAFVAGFVDAIAGGGGVITFPTLIMLGLPVRLIVGTNKLVSSCGTLIAAITFFKSGQVNKEIVKFALPFTCVSALIGAIVVLQVSNDFLKPLVAILVLTLAVYMTFKPQLGGTSAYGGLSSQIQITLAIGASVLGFYDGFFGPGTGMFLAYLMVRYINLDFINATGNTKCLNLASNLVPLAFFISIGNIRYDLAIPMAIANMLGGYLGAKFAIKNGPQLVRITSIVMALALVAKMILER
jgi:uncharacterized protein